MRLCRVLIFHNHFDICDSSFSSLVPITFFAIAISFIADLDLTFLVRRLVTNDTPKFFSDLIGGNTLVASLGIYSTSTQLLLDNLHPLLTMAGAAGIELAPPRFVIWRHLLQ